MSQWVREGYATALQRLDVLLHREILRLRATYELSLDEFRGLYVSDQQVDELVLGQQLKAEGEDAVSIAQMTAFAEQLQATASEHLQTDTQWRDVTEVYQLSPFEQDILLLALAPELHSKYEVLYAYLNNDITRKYPSVDLALRLFAPEDNDHRRAVFSHRGNLFAEGLLQLQVAANNPYWLQQGFHLAATIRGFIVHRLAMDPGLKYTLKLQQPSYLPWPQAPFTQAVSEQLASLAIAMAEADDTPFIVLAGTTFSGRDFAAENCLADSGLAVLTVDLVTLLENRDQLQDNLQSIRQSALLSRAGVIVSGLDELLQAEFQDAVLIKRVLVSVSGLPLPVFFLVDDRYPWRPLLQGYKFLVCKIPAAGSEEREAIWQFHLQGAELAKGSEDLAAVADFFNLDFSQIQAAAEDVKFRTHFNGMSQPAINRDALFLAAKQQSYGAIGTLAQRVKHRYTLDDLILPPAVLLRINEVIAAIENRRTVYLEWGMGRRVGAATGIAALFAGASGTGKTMTASVIGDAIGLDVYRIDLAGIVSKYIGETEKNLDKIFNAAAQANCILFFDEADALFGKRSEVKDAHDRYANIEVAYLLQKMENHDGIVILTTNLLRSIDQAFSRRVQFIVEFPRPSEADRENIWRGMFTERAPLATDVDFNFLARQFENTGGEIKNIALDAAMMAANSERKIIDMALLVRAAARQMVKQGKVPSSSEFKHYFNLVTNE